MKLVLEERKGNFVRKNIRDHADQEFSYFQWSPKVFSEGVSEKTRKGSGCASQWDSILPSNIQNSSVYTSSL